MHHAASILASVGANLLESSRAENRRKGRRAQPAAIRLAHWINIPLIVIMAGSGLQILAAYPSLGLLGAQIPPVSVQNHAPPSWLRFGGWLAGARHWHFAMAWFLIFNGLIYLIYMIASGEWRRRVFIPTRDTSSALAMFAYYLRIRKTLLPEGLLQRPAAHGVHLRDPLRPGGGLLGTGDLQTGAAAMDYRGVRRIRRRACCASELPGFARIVHGDAPGTRRAASADYCHDGDRRAAW